MADVTQCRSCGVSVMWLRGASTGRLAPIESEPAADGNLHIDLEKGTYHLANVGCPKDAPRYVNHFARCPQAREWKRRQPQAGRRS